ncbi:MAG: SIMPL domain-containing protein [Bacteroidia bacterium]|jgi:uncharacterized protein YggE
MKTLSSLACLALSMSGYAQSAGNTIQAASTGNATYSLGNSNYIDSYGNGFVPYNQPRGVNLNPTSTNPTSTPIKADVMINMRANSYVALLSVTQVGESIEETDSLMDIRLNQVFDELKKVGISIASTHVDFISMVPKYDFESTEKRYSKTFNEVPAGFEMKKNIHVKFEEHDRINDLISAAAKAEIYDLVKIDYNIADMDLIYEQLRKKAEDIIARKTESYSRMGFTLEAQHYASTQGSVYPMERYVKYTAAHTTQPKIKADKPGKEKTVDINYSEKPSTVYYEKVPYGQFDVVLNPDLAEPAVQFYLNLTVNYKIVLAEVAKREKEDRELDLQLRRAEIQQKIKNAGGSVNNNTTVTVRTR